MKKSLLDAVAAVVATIALAYILYLATGRNWIGYDLVTRLTWSGLIGVVVAVVTTGARLSFPRLSPIVTAPCAVLAFWFVITLAMPGNNAGLSLFHVGVSVGMGLWIGAGISLARRFVGARS